MSIFVGENNWFSLAERIQVVSDAAQEVWVGTGKDCIKVYPVGTPEVWWYTCPVSGGQIGQREFHLCNGQDRVPSTASTSGVVEHWNLMGDRPFNGYCQNVMSVIIDEPVYLPAARHLFHNFTAANTWTNMDKLNLSSSCVDTNRMFQNCDSLTRLDISHISQMSNVTDLVYMFQGCNVLNEIVLPNNFGASAPQMDSLFAGCAALATLDPSKISTGNCTNFASMFSGCSSLTSLNLSMWDTSSATDMRSMFDACRLVTSINMSGWDTSNVVYMQYMFQNCNSVTSLNMSGWDTTSVENMSYMFSLCSDIRVIDISSFSTPALTDCRSMFSVVSSLNRTALETIIASPSFVTTALPRPYYGTNMFNYCTNLVGGAGTTWDSNHTDSTYAHIDGVGGPGYFTAA